MSNSDNFFIKPGYKLNENAVTYEMTDNDKYWTNERIRTSSKFQYHVYLLAAKLSKKYNLKSFIDIGSGPAVKAKKIIDSVIEKTLLIDQPNCEVLARQFYPEAQFIAGNLETCDFSVPFLADIIVCADVLEHLFNPMHCLNFSHNHLSTHGIAIFSTPERDILRGPDCMTSPHQAHVREWNQEEFKQLLEYAGFHVIEQLLLPASKMSYFEEILWVLSKSVGLPGRVHWRSCQVAICRKA